MDLFNKKKLERTTNELRKVLDEKHRANAIIKYLVEEPDGEIAKMLRIALYEKFISKKWSGLTRESHLGNIFTTQNDYEDRVKFLLSDF